MALKLFNTMGKRLQEFVPIQQGFCGFYCCGPTGYNYAHIGNLRAYVFLDTLDRTLTFLGYKKKHVMNITDIGHLTGDADDGEDKMLKTAKERQQSVLDIAKFYTDAFFSDIDRLNILRPDVVCKATDHVPEMIELIKKIEANGHTYMAGGNLYYDVSTYPDYGKLANLNLDDLQAGAGKRKVVVVDQNKRNPQDFVLWFTKSKFEEQALVWDSPWGKGRPGWHTECCVMIHSIFADQKGFIDIHGGGFDLKFPHHENEIAQAMAHDGHRLAQYWMHNGFININNVKMSKSLGNVVLMKDVVNEYGGIPFRLMLLASHYRAPASFSPETIQEAQVKYQQLETSLRKAAIALERHDIDIDSLKAKDDTPFYDALCDDLNTPNALAALYEDNKLLNTLWRTKNIDYDHLSDVFAQVKDECDVLGLNMELPHLSKEDKSLYEEYDLAKQNKDFGRSDALRAELMAKHLF